MPAMHLALSLLFKLSSHLFPTARKRTLYRVFQKCMGLCITFALPFVCICLFLNAQQPAINKYTVYHVFKKCAAMYVTIALPFTHFRMCSNLQRKCVLCHVLRKTAMRVAFALPFICICAFPNARKSTSDASALCAFITFHLHLYIS